IATDSMMSEALEHDRAAGIEAMEAIAAIGAGADLVLFYHSLQKLENAIALTLHSARRGLVREDEVQASARRILGLKQWLKNQPQPPIDVIGCREHRALAAEVAARSM